MTKLEKILIEKEIKQIWLAIKINKSPTVLNRWVKGKRIPTYKNMLKISKALNMPLGKIFLNDDVKVSAKSSHSNGNININSNKHSEKIKAKA